MVYVTLIQPSGANGRRKFANRREGDQILRWFELHAALVSALGISNFCIIFFITRENLKTGDLKSSINH